jgi:hypothetical protein
VLPLTITIADGFALRPRSALRCPLSFEIGRAGIVANITIPPFMTTCRKTLHAEKRQG